MIRHRFWEQVTARVCYTKWYQCHLNVSIVRCGLLLNKYMIQHYVVTHISHVAWASYQISKLADCACAGNVGNVFPHRQLQRKPLVSDPGMHHGTYLTHVPWCISGSLTRGNRENVLGIPSACAPVILRIWQAHTSTCIFHTPSHETCFTTALQTSHQKDFCRLKKNKITSPENFAQQRCRCNTDLCVTKLL